MMKALLILNDPPYGTERSYNGLRLAGTLVKRAGDRTPVAGQVVAGADPPNGDATRTSGRLARAAIPVQLCASQKCSLDFFDLPAETRSVVIRV
jgi:hypothetical protein